MGSDKDLYVCHEYNGGRNKSPLVKPISRFEEKMYNEMEILNKRLKIIETILEACNEK